MIGQRGNAVKHRELYPTFCDNLYGKRIWKRMDVCICVTESLLYSRNYHNIVNQIYLNKFFFFFFKKRVPVVAHRITNPTSIHEDAGLILALLSGLRIQHCCELWHRSRTWLRSWLLWLWCRLAAVVPIQLLAWELTYAVGVALKNKQKQKERKKKKKKGREKQKSYGPGEDKRGVEKWFRERQKARMKEENQTNWNDRKRTKGGAV